jgi:protein translocase SecG subunit
MAIIFFIGLLLYLVVCGVLISLILAQEGKGGGLSGVMGSSMGETFGFGGANKTIKKFTSIAATAFLVLSVVLTFIGDAMINSSSDTFIGSAVPASTKAPAATAPAASPAAGAQPGTNPPGMVVKTETGPAAPAGANAPAANTAAGPAPKMPSAAAPAAPAVPQPAGSNTAAPAAPVNPAR